MVLKIRKARPEEIDKGFSLLIKAAEWLSGKEVNNWSIWLNPSKEYTQWVKEGFSNNEFYFAENEDMQIVCMFRLQFEDETIWGKREDKAGYVHSFTVDREFKGNNIGYTVLSMIEKILLEKNINILRLDCSSDSLRLKKYYEEFGFHSKGEVTLSVLDILKETDESGSRAKGVTIPDETLQLYEKIIK